MDICIGANTTTKGLLNLRMANRHGLISGATGTGKTVSVQLLAEQFSRAGVPVFLADIKGDLAGLARPGSLNDKLQTRLHLLGIQDFNPSACPVVLWDLFGEQGHPVRATISDMGPLLLASLMELNETQSAVLHAVFSIADKQGLLLLDCKDLKSMLNWVRDNAKSLQDEYGNLPAQSINAIVRALVVLEEQGGEYFFGEPALELSDLMQIDFSGNGVISLLNGAKLIHQPRLYSMFLLWLLAELFEQLPEVGDMEKPKLVFFFDEAHLLFDNAPKVLLEKIEQVVRLIRSKGVGIYFISQHPTDVPQDILGQLGLRVQHALRAFTPKDEQAVKVAAQTFRQNPALDTYEAITQLGVGEALFSALDEKGAPSMVEKILVNPPQSRIGPLSSEEVQAQRQRSPLNNKYDTPLDRESAYEILKQRSEQQLQWAPPAQKKTGSKKSSSTGGDILTAMAKSAARSMGSQLGRQIMRGLLGSLTGSRRR